MTSPGADRDVLHTDGNLTRLFRPFAGLSVEETAMALEVSPRTVQNEWMFTRTWLHRALNGEPSHAQ